MEANDQHIKLAFLFFQGVYELRGQRGHDRLLRGVWRVAVQDLRGGPPEGQDHQGPQDPHPGGRRRRVW